jgi:hypothetical protein
MEITTSINMDSYGLNSHTMAQALEAVLLVATEQGGTLSEAGA